MSNVIVQFDPYAKTGNRLCQFAFGIILAKEKKVPFYSQPIPGFLGTYGYSDTFQSTPEQIQTIQFGAHNIDYNLLLSTNNTIIINSYLQKYHYYINHLQFLQNTFYIKNEPEVNIDQNELVIHIRGTDYRDGNVHIRDDIYFDVINKLSPSKVSIVTDDNKLQVIEQLCKEGANLITKNNLTNKGNGLNEYEIYDFVYMLKAKNLLISQSTFSWWAAFLGDQHDVYVPYDLSKNCMWKVLPQTDDIDLIPEQNKFKKIIYENNKRS